MSRHLSDDRLIEICLAGPNAPSDPHLAACGACGDRRAALADMLDDISAAAASEADAVFTADRLARHRARVLQQIDRATPLGRVIAFPALAQEERAAFRARAATRWVAAAAVAGLVVGLLAGHLAHDLPGSPAAPTAEIMVANEADDGGRLRAVSTTLSDDEFLSEVEMAVGSTGPAALRPLDRLTPRAWEVR